MLFSSGLRFRGPLMSAPPRNSWLYGRSQEAGDFRITGLDSPSSTLPSYRAAGYRTFSPPKQFRPMLQTSGATGSKQVSASHYKLTDLLNIEQRPSSFRMILRT